MYFVKSDAITCDHILTLNFRFSYNQHDRFSGEVLTFPPETDESQSRKGKCQQNEVVFLNIWQKSVV